MQFIAGKIKDATATHFLNDENTLEIKVTLTANKFQIKK